MRATNDKLRREAATLTSGIEQAVYDLLVENADLRADAEAMRAILLDAVMLLDTVSPYLAAAARKGEHEAGQLAAALGRMLERAEVYVTVPGKEAA